MSCQVFLECIRSSPPSVFDHFRDGRIFYVWRWLPRYALFGLPTLYRIGIFFSETEGLFEGKQLGGSPSQIKNKLQTHARVDRTIRTFTTKIISIATACIPNVTEPNSQRANFSPFTKDYRELGLSMWIHNFSNPGSPGSSFNQKKYQYQAISQTCSIVQVQLQSLPVIITYPYKSILIKFVGELLQASIGSQFQQQNMHMKKYIDDCMQSDAKHLMSLHGLLDVYDRENKYLNRQVLELLEENISLKKHRNRDSLITRQNYHLLQKQNPDQTESYGRGSSKKIVDKYKVGEETPQRPVIQKRDEGIQVSDFATQANESKISSKKEEISICRDPYLNEKDAVLFSFGPDTGRKEDTKNTTAQGLDLHFNETLKKSNQIRVLSPQRQQKQIFKSPSATKGRQESPPKGQVRSFVSIEDIDLKTLPKKPDILNKSPEKKREESQAKDRRTNKSQHSIKPSPQLTPSNRSSKHLNTPCPSEKQLALNEPFDKLRKYESSDRKKKFIDMLSTKLTPSRIMKVQDRDCC